MVDLRAKRGDLSGIGKVGRGLPRVKQHAIILRIIQSLLHCHVLIKLQAHVQFAVRQAEVRESSGVGLGDFKFLRRHQENKPRPCVHRHQRRTPAKARWPKTAVTGFSHACERTNTKQLMCEARTLNVGKPFTLSSEHREESIPFISGRIVEVVNEMRARLVRVVRNGYEFQPLCLVLAVWDWVGDLARHINLVNLKVKAKTTAAMLASACKPKAT